MKGSIKQKKYYHFMFSNTPNRSQLHLVSHSNPYVIKKEKTVFFFQRKL